MVDSSPPKSPEPPPATDPDDQASTERAEASQQPDDVSGMDISSEEEKTKKPDTGLSAATEDRVSLVELDLEPDPSTAGREATTPPPPPTGKASSPPADHARPLPKPGFKSKAAETPLRSSMLPPRKFPPQQVGDIMTRRLIALTERDTVENIGSGMQRFRFRHLPVVSTENKLIGLVTHQDLLKAAAKAAAKSPDGKAELAKNTPVTTVMNRDVLATTPEMALATAANAMLQKKIGCLPVILQDKTLVGIITEADFVKLSVVLLTRDQSAKGDNQAKDDD